MPSSPLDHAIDPTGPADLARAALAALRARGADPAIDGHRGHELADRIDAYAKALANRSVRPGELVTVAAPDPLGVLAGCLAVWQSGAVPAVGAGERPARLELLAAEGTVCEHPVDAVLPDAALVVSEPLVGTVAHRAEGLRPLRVPGAAADRLVVLADWRADAWIPATLDALVAGTAHLSLRRADAPVDQAPDTVLAAPAARLAVVPPLTRPAAFAGWVSWGAAVPDLPADRHRHGFGDHFVLATARPATAAGGRSVRADVLGRHRVCNAAGRPLPTSAWGLLALAGRLPVVGDSLDAVLIALAAGSGERTWTTDYRARRRSDGSTEFDLGDLDALRIAGRRLSPTLLAPLPAAAGLPDAALLTRDPDTDRARLVLCATGPEPAPAALARLAEALPDWAAPLGVSPVATLPRDATGFTDLARLASSAAPDTHLLAEAGRTLTARTGSPVTLTAVPGPVETGEQPLPDGFAAGGGHYPRLRPAAVTGVELSPPPGDLVDRLRSAAASGNGILLVDGEGREHRLSYADLLADATRVAGFLRARGLGHGDEVVVHSSWAGDIFSGVWGCVLTGVLPVPLTPATPYDAAGNPLWHLLGPDTMLTGRTVLTTEAQLPALTEVLARRGLAADLLTLDEARAHRPLAEEDFAPRSPALMLLTSGSTGAPKGVALSHRNLVSLAEAVRNEFALEDEVSLNWLGVDHVGGLVQHHVRDLCLAHEQIHADTGFVLADPTRMLDLMDAHRVTVSWMANFGFTLINEQAEKIEAGHWDLASVKVWENGGEAVSHEGNQRFLALLAPHGLAPDVIKPVFGMTETSSAIIAAHNLVAGRSDYVHWVGDASADRPVERALPGEGSPFAEVGGPMAGISLRVVDSRGEVCPEGVAGRIEVSGPQVMDGYYRNPRADAETFTADGWLRMGDLGFVVDGSLVVTGREKDVVIINGLNYAARALESSIETVPGVRQGCCAAVPVRRPDGSTDDLVVFYSSTADATADPVAIEAALVAEHSLRPVAVVEIAPEEWPRTAIGKIRRPVLAQGFQRGDFADRITLRREHGLGNRTTLPDWHFVPHWEPAARPVPVAGARVLWLGAHTAPEGALSASCGAPFDGFDEAGRARYRAADAADIAALFTAAAERLGGLDAVVDTSLRTAPVVAEAATSAHALAAAHLGWSGLLSAAASLSVPPAVVLATGSAVVVTGDEPSVAHAALPGIAESLAQSHPALTVTLVDGADDVALAAEATARGRLQVAYRGDRRLVRTLRPLASRPVRPVPARVLREGGRYLVIGGAGGIGSHLSQHLLRRFGARVLVIGRKPAEPGGERADLLRYLADQASAEHGGEIRYVAADAADAQALRAAVEAVEHDWGGPLDAVFNLAGEGSVTEQLDALANPDGATDDRMLWRAQERIHLCHTLDDVLAERSTTVVVFSSVNGFFGGVGFAHYAGACSYQAAHAAWSAARGGRATICLDWSMWKQLGMATGTPAEVVELARRRGFETLGPAQGLSSLHVALDGAEQHVLIGLAPGGTAVSGLLPFGTVPYLVAVDGMTDPAPAAAELGLPVASVRPVRSGPKAVTGVPSTHTEALLAVFRDVLARPEVTAEDNFFASGGDSIRAIQAVARAAERGFRFSPLDLFEHKTVTTLLTHLAGQDLPSDVPGADGPLEADGPVVPPPVFGWWLEKADRPEVRNHLTMSMRYRLDPHLGAEQLTAALTGLVRRHEALRLRLTGGPGRWRLVSADVEDDNLRFETHELPAAGFAAGGAVDAVERTLHRGLDPAEGPVVRAALVRADDGSQAQLLLVVHHAAVDGVSWRIVEEDLLRLVEAELRGVSAELPPATTGFLAWADRLHTRAARLDGTALADAWLARLDGGWGVLPGTPEVPPLESDTEVLTRRLPAETLAALGDTSVYEVLLTAVGWSLARWSGAGAMALNVEGHGRLDAGAPVDLSRTVGWFTAIAPVRLDLDGCATPGPAVPRVRAALEDLRGRDQEWGLLRHQGLCPPGHPLLTLPERQVSFNYLGVFDSAAAPDGVFAAVPGSLGAEQSPLAERHHLIDVAAVVADGELELAVKYSPGVHSEVEISHWLDSCEKVLRELIAESADRAPSVAGIDEDELLLALAEVSLGDEGP